MAHDDKLVLALLSTTRQRGYGEREENIYPKTSAIAVPVFLDRRVMACLNITFIASVLSPKDAATRYLKLMQDASKAIESRARTLA